MYGRCTLQATDRRVAGLVSVQHGCLEIRTVKNVLMPLPLVAAAVKLFGNILNAI